MIISVMEPSITDWFQGWAAMAQLVLSIVTVGFFMVTFKFTAETFRLQQETLDDQRELLRLEMEKDRRSIKPVFKIKEHYFSTGGEYEEFGFTLILTRNMAQIIKVQVDDSNELEILPAADFYTELEIGESKIFKTLKKPPKKTIMGVFSIEFADEDGRFYNQEVHLLDGSFAIFLPELDPLFVK